MNEVEAIKRRGERLRALVLYRLYVHLGRGASVTGVYDCIIAELAQVSGNVAGQAGAMLGRRDVGPVVEGLAADKLLVILRSWSGVDGAGHALQLTSTGRAWVEGMAATRGGPPESADLAQALVWVAEHWTGAGSSVSPVVDSEPVKLERPARGDGERVDDDRDEFGYVSPEVRQRAELFKALKDADPYRRSRDKVARLAAEMTGERYSGFTVRNAYDAMKRAGYPGYEWIPAERMR